MKHLYLLLSFATLTCAATAQVKKAPAKPATTAAAKPAPAGICPHPIYLDTLDIDINVKALKDTFRVSMDAARYLKVYVSDCNGSLYFEQRVASNDRIMLKGQYTGVPEAEFMSMRTVDPVTGDIKFNERTVYVAKKTGTWQYFGPKGVVTEEQDFENGHLKDDRTMGDY